MWILKSSTKTERETFEVLAQCMVAQLMWLQEVATSSYRKYVKFVKYIEKWQFLKYKSNIFSRNSANFTPFTGSEALIKRNEDTQGKTDQNLIGIPHNKVSTCHF